ncbi:MAG: hypothetical protein KGY56_10880 [Desulfobacterales bacterium]|nr:hypothetical protein [Desulfobacterales bacterium]
MKMIFGHCTSLMSYDTYPFKDYSKMDASRFDVGHKEKRRREVFPMECEKARFLGIDMAVGQ